MRKIIFLTLLICLAGVMAHAQIKVGFINGEITKMDGQKMICLVEHASSYEGWVRFKFSQTSSIDSVSIDQVKFLKNQFQDIENITYDSVQFLTQKQAKGKYDLFVYTSFKKPVIDESKVAKDTTYHEDKYTITRTRLKGSFAYRVTSLYLLRMND
jgi:hypothetical protein